MKLTYNQKKKQIIIRSNRQIVRINQCQRIQMMEEHEYAQMIVRLNYINTVCDQLLGGDGRKGRVDYNGVGGINERGSQQFRGQKSLKIRQVDSQLQYGKQYKKFLTKQISALKQPFPQVKKLSNKAMRELSSLQVELNHTRRLLNSELHNLNSINMSKGQISEGIDKFEERQVRLRNKLQKLSRQEREYVQCQQLQSEYEQLLAARNNLLQQLSQQRTTRRSSVYSKLTAIAQSAQTIKQMHTYQQRLTQLILQQNFIIQEISSREQTNPRDKTQYQVEHSSCDGSNNVDDDGLNIFQEEVQVLRKTIDNRSFITQRHNVIKRNNNGRLDRFVNHPTPKNAMQQKTRAYHKSLTHNTQLDHITSVNINHTNAVQSVNPNSSSIFKISVQPISHSKRIFTTESPIIQLNHLENQSLHINELGSFEIEALERILKTKQDQIQQAIITNNKSSHHKPHYLSTDTNQLPFSLTQPIQLHQQTNPTKDLSNSRFIQQLIETKNHQNRHHGNVRIRTKKSQSQSYKNHINKVNSQKVNQNQHKNQCNYPHRHHNLSTRKVNFSLQDKSKPKMSSTFQRKLSLVDVKQQQSYIVPSQSTNIKQISNGLTTQLTNQQLNGSIQFSPLKKLSTPKRKYKDKIFDLHHKDLSIDNVFKKIYEIKKTQQEQRQKDKQKQTKSSKTKTDKIKIFKQLTARKHGNPTMFKRKGIALGVEDSGSQLQQLTQQQCQIILPRIAEQQQSIRNTLQSTARN